MPRAAHVDGTPSRHLDDLDSWLEQTLARVRSGRASPRMCCDLAAIARSSRIDHWPEASPRVLEADAIAVARGWSAPLQDLDAWQLFTFRHRGDAIAVRGGGQPARITFGRRSVELAVPGQPKLLATPGGDLESARIDRKVVRIHLGGRSLVVRRSRLDLGGRWRLEVPGVALGGASDQRIGGDAGFRLRTELTGQVSGGALEVTDARLDW